MEDGVSVITGAGVIMSIAFAGLMMSSTAVLLECGVYWQASKKRRAAQKTKKATQKAKD
jgi:hypothetical protein